MAHNIIQQPSPRFPQFDLSMLSHDRIAKHCVCCGSSHLKKSPAILMPFVAHRALGWEPVVIDESWRLKTIRNGHAYSICNSLWCSECGFLFLDIRFSDSEMNSLYHEYRGKEYNELRERYEPGYSSQNDSLNAGIPYISKIEEFLEPHLTFPLSILDWGGDTGKNTPFKNRNEVFDIYDISNKPVIEGANCISRKQAFSKKYSLVVCSNVLEHVPFPADLILDIKNTMDDSSILYVEVPYEEIMRTGEKNLHLKKKHWHEHINFYSEESLIRLLGNCGLETIATNKLRPTTEGKTVHLLQVACKLESKGA